MAQTYLEKFRSIIPKKQGDQILRLLREKYEDGEIRTPNEIKSKLQELTNNLLDQEIQPTFTLWKAILDDDISSEQFNDMVKSIDNDLETCFAEVDSLFEILDVHNEVIDRTALQSVERSLNKLEREISALEFLKKNSHNFNLVLSNTFKDILGTTVYRDSNIGEVVFTDPRQEKFLDASYNAYIDPIGERLILGANNTTYRTISGIEYISSSSTTQTELDCSFADLDINNLIDGQKNTYWAVPIVISSPITTGTKTEILIYLPATQHVNFIEVDTATRLPLKISAIKYIDQNGDTQTLTETSIKLDKSTHRINFQSIKAKQIIIQFHQENYTEIQFDKNNKNGRSDKSNLLKNLKYLDPNIGPDVLDNITNDFIYSDILGGDSVGSVNVRYYEYLFALDNIRVGYSDYDKTSIFVSDKKQSAHPINRLGLKTTETRPSQASGSSSIVIEDFTYPVSSFSQDNTRYHGSIEYWGTVDFLTSTGASIDRRTFPILPLNANRIYHERLVFSKKVDLSNLYFDGAALMFYTNADSSDVIVYRNGTELTYGTDWTFISASSPSNLTVETPNTGKRMKRGIQLTNRTGQLDNYTVSYTPVLSNTTASNLVDDTLLRIVDLTGDNSVRLGPNKLIIIEPSLISNQISKCNIYLTIILRNNSADTTITPAVEEYTLGIGEIINE